MHAQTHNLFCFSFTKTRPITLQFLSRIQLSSPWAYQCVIAVDWCIIALVNLPVGG